MSEDTWVSPRKAQWLANHEAFEAYLIARDAAAIANGFCVRCGRPNCTIDHDA